MVIKSLLLSLVVFMFLSAGIPEDIYDKTWHVRDGELGAQFVIYKDQDGAVMAIWQREGATVFVEESIIYEVSLSGNKLHFNNGDRVLGQENKPVENISFTYSHKRIGFISSGSANPYLVLDQEPIIYSKYGWLINLEELKDNSYEKRDFQ